MSGASRYSCTPFLIKLDDASYNSFSGALLLHADCEWCPNWRKGQRNSVAIFTLASARFVLILHLSCMGLSHLPSDRSGQVP
jgi:hypothetical protein